MNKRETLMVRVFALLVSFLGALILVSTFGDVVNARTSTISRLEKQLNGLQGSSEEQMRLNLLQEKESIEKILYLKQSEAAEYGSKLRQLATESGRTLVSIRIVREDASFVRWELLLRGRPAAVLSFFKSLHERAIPHAIQSINFQRYKAEFMESRVEIAYAKHP